MTVEEQSIAVTLVLIISSSSHVHPNNSLGS